MSRFDYVKYDELALAVQNEAKEKAIALEIVINGLESPRAKALALTKLEEVYMWIGKAVRDDLLKRAPAPLQEERGNE